MSRRNRKPWSGERLKTLSVCAMCGTEFHPFRHGLGKFHSVECANAHRRLEREDDRFDQRKYP